MWSFGATLASIIFKREPFFHGKSNTDQLVQIARVLGTDDLYKYLKKYNLTLGPEYEDLGYFIKRPWHRFINELNHPFVNEEVIDFIDKLLRYDHEERLTAKEAMAHPWLAEIREERMKSKDANP
ncbi:unnamed protein product [[Candida] boidinii]|nr:unnamed protein product [[Candida] boidinii]